MYGVVVAQTFFVGEGLKTSADSTSVAAVSVNSWAGWILPSRGDSIVRVGELLPEG